MPDAAAPLRVLIADDEPLARDRIKELLQEEDVVVVGEAQDGEEAVAMIRDLEPDLVFLDVQMPGMTGVDVVETIGAADMPFTVFVTAYDQYAIKAFEVSAVDYLLKPFDDERFGEALQRVRQRIQERQGRNATETLRRLLQEHQEGASPTENGDEADTESLDRIAVQSRGQVRIVPVEEITHITADGSYAELHTDEGTHVIRERMKTLADRLNPKEFVRIHRSAIVRLDEVESILRSGGGDYAVRLHDGTRLSLSRGRVDALKERLGVEGL